MKSTGLNVGAMSLACLTGLLLTERPMVGADKRAAPKPVPLMQAVPLPDYEISFQREGIELARYHFNPALRRPFVFPVVGPSGRSLTRMGHPHDPESHSHHNSVWISHHVVDGLSFWEDRSGNRIQHKRILRLEDSD